MHTHTLSKPTCRPMSNAANNISGNTTREDTVTGGLDASSIMQLRNQIYSLALQKTAKSTQDADKLLRRLIDEKLARNHAVDNVLTARLLNEPLRCYKALSEAAAKQAAISGKKVRSRDSSLYATKADELLQHFGLATKRDAAICINKKSYSLVIAAYAKAGNPAKAEEVLRRVEPVWLSGNADLQPDNFVFSSIIHAWARYGTKFAAERAEALLQHMSKLNRKGYASVYPCTFSYSAAINAWARSGAKGAAHRAERILDQMLEMHKNGNADVQPTVHAFSSVANAWAKSGEKEAVQKAEALLARMEELHKQGYANVRPNSHTYSSLIDALAQRGTKESAERAEAILNDMLKLQKSGRDDVRADTYCFNAALNCWARCEEKWAAQRAEALLTRMEELYQQGYADLRPNCISYSTVINAWGQIGGNEAAKRAESILDHVLKLYQSGRSDLHPTTAIFRATMHACSNSGDAEAYMHTQRIFRLMKDFENKNEDNGGLVEVEVSVYTALMDALAVSSTPDKAAIALKLLREMEMDHVAPDVATYGAFFKVCARTSGTPESKRETFRAALEAFDMLIKSLHLKPDPLIYEPLIFAVATSSSGSEKGKAIELIFSWCCKHGTLNEHVLRTLRRTTSLSLFQRLVGSNNSSRTVKLKDLPAEWSRNSHRRDIQRQEGRGVHIH